MPQEYFCPHGCRPKFGIETLKGWKRHMSVKHGMYTQEQLEEATRPSPEGDVQSRMADFASSIEDGVPIDIASDGTIKDRQTGETIPEILPAGQKEPPGTRKVRATPQYLTEILTDIPQKIMEALGVQPDNKDRMALKESSQFLEDVFGVNFEVDESKTTVESRWWAFFWVFGVMALMYVKHKAPEIFKIKTIEEEPTKESV